MTNLIKCKECLKEKPLDSFKKLWGYTNICINCRALSSGKTKSKFLTSANRHFSYKTIAEHADTTAKATRVAAAVAVAGATVAAPTGLGAVGVALGLVSAPAIVSLAPILVAVAGGAAAISAAASLYSKSRRNKESSNK
jgi:hypothetical protein